MDFKKIDGVYCRQDVVDFVHASVLPPKYALMQFSTHERLSAIYRVRNLIDLSADPQERSLQCQYMEVYAVELCLRRVCGIKDYLPEASMFALALQACVRFPYYRQFAIECVQI